MPAEIGTHTADSTTDPNLLHTDYSEAWEFKPVPSGTYVVAIMESVVRATKAGTGSYLELTFRIISGDYETRLLWTRLNLRNPRADTVTYALDELASICRAVGVLAPSDSRELHDRPLQIEVELTHRADTGEEINRVRGYSKRPLPEFMKAGNNPFF